MSFYRCRLSSFKIFAWNSNESHRTFSVLTLCSAQHMRMSGYGSLALYLSHWRYNAYSIARFLGKRRPWVDVIDMTSIHFDEAMISSMTSLCHLMYDPLTTNDLSLVRHSVCLLGQWSQSYERTGDEKYAVYDYVLSGSLSIDVDTHRFIYNGWQIAKRHSCSDWRWTMKQPMYKSRYVKCICWRRQLSDIFCRLLSDRKRTIDMSILLSFDKQDLFARSNLNN
jgi:hypothetical protein